MVLYPNRLIQHKSEALYSEGNLRTMTFAYSEGQKPLQ